MQGRVDIGFAEECSEPWRLASRFFPSKIGGRPAWLELRGIPGPEELGCESCGEPCLFLCQLYAPYEEDERAFHRALLVFVCRSSSCCSPDSWTGSVKVLRSQLSRDNEFYPPEPPIEEPGWRPELSGEKWSRTCNVCGIAASSRCAKCKEVSYCSRVHQLWDWKNGHKGSCGSGRASDTGTTLLFPEYELVIEKEETEPERVGASVEEELEKFEELVKSGRAGSLMEEQDIDDDLLKMASGIEDKTFFKFKKKIESDPDQVIRYNRGGAPLLISSANQPEDIPKCECGSERQFEFQIMPQLLVYLKLENVLNSIDWGVLLIYTCKDSCVPKTKYMQEYVWRQDIVKEDSDDSAKSIDNK